MVAEEFANLYIASNSSPTTEKSLFFARTRTTIYASFFAKNLCERVGKLK